MLGISQTGEGSARLGGQAVRQKPFLSFFAGWTAASSSCVCVYSAYVCVCPSKLCTECEPCFKKTKRPNPNICLVVDIGMKGHAHTRGTRGVAGANAGEEEMEGGRGRDPLCVFLCFSFSWRKDRYFSFFSLSLSLFGVVFFLTRVSLCFKRKPSTQTHIHRYIRHVPYTREKGEL